MYRHLCLKILLKLYFDLFESDLKKKCFNLKIETKSLLSENKNLIVDVKMRVRSI
jgi:hypothetical protein